MHIRTILTSITATIIDHELGSTKKEADVQPDTLHGDTHAQSAYIRRTFQMRVRLVSGTHFAVLPFSPTMQARHGPYATSSSHRDQHKIYLPAMKSSPLIRVLLSLLLLLSQQMAIGHVMSHWAGTSENTARIQRTQKQEPSKGIAHELGCSQCFAYAQLASAIASSIYSLPRVPFHFVHLKQHSSSADCVRTFCAFQSRAPPFS
ncbi:hypothetical protein LXA47_01915 [Massilia sp. P8910]|uniref:hypothetical protein n=1 Tax=Massilia antarctica TaxID=2765360 RepID=UPI001E60DCEC|nr:hypothetical protein [Massilia antarctica]MCE3602369.1 hypothetical protein [Massilia antarctica]